MNRRMLFAALLALPLSCFAKGETTRIEVARGKVAVITLEGPEEAGQFTIWSGPGTSMLSNGEPVAPDDSRDFADWDGGPVDPPGRLQVYSVRFYCAAAGETTRESVPSHLCYGVRYAFDRTGKRGYIQIPRTKDSEFPENARTIYRGVEGTWYRASNAWEAMVRTQLQAARIAELEAQRERDRQYRYRERVYVDSPSTRAISATPKVTPKPR